MCMEDIRIGEASPSHMFRYESSGVPEALLPPNGNRRAVLISPQEGATANIGTREAVGGGWGLAISWDALPFLYSIDLHGAIVQEEIWIEMGNFERATIVEITLPPKTDFPRDGQ